MCNVHNLRTHLIQRVIHLEPSLLNWVFCGWKAWWYGVWSDQGVSRVQGGWRLGGVAVAVAVAVAIVFSHTPLHVIHPCWRLPFCTTYQFCITCLNCELDFQPSFFVQSFILTAEWLNTVSSIFVNTDACMYAYIAITAYFLNDQENKHSFLRFTEPIHHRWLDSLDCVGE